MLTTRQLFERRTRRTRYRLRLRSKGALRFSVFRSARQIYAQIIDDSRGVTLASASTLEKDVAQRLQATAGEAGGKKAAAAEVGRLIAERAQSAGISAVVFDRGSYRYHGRVKSLADAARSAGLQF